MRKLLLSLTAFLLFTGSLLAQKSITGTVTDDKGNPLPNVSVVVKGTTMGTVTKSDGSFSLSLPANARQLEFSFLGYATQTVSVGSGSKYSIKLVSAVSKEIEEVVVTGISRVKKSQFAGAANKIDGKDIANKPVGSLDQLFQGRVPGVLAITGSGQPGNASTVIIRGTNSVQGGSTPLYILDGIPVEAAVFQSLNPNDFASMEVLRDAATAALYGSRGSAGVIVITTKRGGEGKMKLSYSGQIGVKQRPDFPFRPMTTAELLAAQADYGKLVGGAANTNVAIPGWYYSKNNPRYLTLTGPQQATADHLLDSISQINTNWADYVFRQGNFSNHEVTLSGGSGKTRVYTNLGLYNEEGTTNRTDMKRVTLRNNIDYSDDKLTMSVSTNIGYTKRNFQQSATTNSLGNPFLIANINVPYATVFKPTGGYATGTGNTFAGANTLDLTYYDKNYNDQIKGTISVSLSYKLTKEITAALTSGIDFRETQNTNYGSKLAYSRVSSSTPTTNAGFQTEGLNRFLTSDIRPSVSYHKMFAEKHDIEVTAVGEYVQENAKNFQLTGYGIDPRLPNTPAAITQGNGVNLLFANAGGGNSRTGLASGLALARYTFNQKYTVTGSYRYDGSSYLPKDNRWVSFYSVGAIWELSKEDFIHNIRAINVLRIRASYGGAGNANNFPANYLYQATYGTSAYSGIPSQVVAYPGNPDAKWETAFTTNLGLDFELFNRRLYGDFNVYRRKTKDLYLTKQLTAEAGGFSINVNAGDLQNQGFEWNVNYDVIRNSNLTWTVSATGAYNQNKLTSLGGVQPYTSGTSYLKVGLPLGSHFEVKWGGVDAATGAPLYYDLNGKLTTDYQTSNAVADFGTYEAPWKGGFGSSLKYKGFDFSVLFSWQQGAYKYDNLEYFVENPVGFLGVGFNQSSDLHFWKKPGDIVNTPNPNFGTNFSSKLIHNSSFMRLRDLTLAYTLPSTVTERIKFISNVKLYVQGSNLFIWTKWRGMDPEAGPININLSEFPNPRAFTGGLSVTF